MGKKITLAQCVEELNAEIRRIDPDTAIYQRLAAISHNLIVVNNHNLSKKHKKIRKKRDKREAAKDYTPKEEVVYAIGELWSGLITLYDDENTIPYYTSFEDASLKAAQKNARTNKPNFFVIPTLRSAFDD